MKKTIIIIAIAIVCLSSLMAGTHTHTITLIAKVEKTLPQFELVSAFGRGDSVAVTTSRIASENVRADFSIMQTNDSNFKGSVHFTVSASQLSNGASHTTGKVIRAFGSEHDTLSFTRVYDHCQGACEVASFSVEWMTRDGLSSGVYTGIVTLTTVID